MSDIIMRAVKSILKQELSIQNLADQSVNLCPKNEPNRVKTASFSNRQYLCDTTRLIVFAGIGSGTRRVQSLGKLPSQLHGDRILPAPTLQHGYNDR